MTPFEFLESHGAIHGDAKIRHIKYMEWPGYDHKAPKIVFVKCRICGCDQFTNRPDPTQLQCAGCGFPAADVT